MEHPRIPREELYIETDLRDLDTIIRSNHVKLEVRIQWTWSSLSKWVVNSNQRNWWKQTINEGKKEGNRNQRKGTARNSITKMMAVKERNHSLFHQK